MQFVWYFFHTSIQAVWPMAGCDYQASLSSLSIKHFVGSYVMDVSQRTVQKKRKFC
jgi:hypothetical protein